MISQPLPNLKTQFSQKEEVGSYDNIALNQRSVSVSGGRGPKNGSKGTNPSLLKRERFSIEHFMPARR